MKCFDFIDLLERTLLVPLEDWTGLYEQLWAIDEGDFEDRELRVSKKLPWQRVAQLNETLLKHGYLELGVLRDREFEVQSDFRVLWLKTNWQPFRLGIDQGYSMSITDKGSRLLSALAKRHPMRF